MPSLGRDTIANIAGQGWAALWNFGLAPVYARLLGMEAYGLVGFFLMMQATLALLDLGLTPAMTREMARYSARPEKADEARDFAHSLESMCWAIGLVVGLSAFALAPAVGIRWVRANTLSPESVRSALGLMGLVLAAQWPISLYSGGLMGMQRQILLNVVNASAATVRGLGSLFVLHYFSPTVTVFFVWQLIAGAIHTAVLVALYRASLPSGTRPSRFRLSLVAAVGPFAAGLSGISVVSFLLTQLDKIVLSRILPLELFGYYALASILGASLQVLISPVFRACFPRFSRLVATPDDVSLARTYHQACQLMSAIVLPVALVAILFSPELLLAWTGNSRVVAHTQSAARLLLAGTALNGLASLPYALQLAHGWTRLALGMGIAQVALLTPLAVALASRFGPAGGASVWLLLNAMYVFVSVPLMHRRILPGSLASWYRDDIGRPLVAATTIVLLARAAVPIGSGRLSQVLILALMTGVAIVGSALAAPLLRPVLLARLGRRGQVREV